MSEIVKNVGNYTISDFEIETRKGVAKLSELRETITITSSVFEPTLRGSMRLLDRTDLIAKYNVTGGEIVTLNFQVNNDELVKHRFVVIRITDEASESTEGSKRYVIDFISEDHPNFMKQYALSLKGLVTDMMSSFLKNKIGSRKPLVIEKPSQWPMHFVTQMWTGYTIIDFLKTRAFNGNSGYHFFETWKEFRFVNLVDEFNKPPVQKLYKKEDMNPTDLTYAIYDQVTIKQLGHYDNMMNAGYSNNGAFFDPLAKKYTPTRDQSHEFDRQTMNAKTTPKSNRFFRNNYTRPHPNMPDPHIVDMVQKRYMQWGTLEDVVITVRVPGHSKIRPGVTVELMIKDTQRNMEGEREDLAPLQGIYLVAECQEQLGDEWHQFITLMKFKSKKS